jgi:streptogramin lyase
VLAADEVSGELGVSSDKGVLTKIGLGDTYKPEYAFDYDLLAVASGEGAVWVVAVGDRNSVLRINPRTGAVLREVPFPIDARIDGIAVGEGAVWVMDSESALLYRIDPASSTVTGKVDVGEEAGEPVAGDGFVWTSTERPGLLRVDPRTLRVTGVIPGPPSDTQPLGAGTASPFDVAFGEGSVWWNSLRSGTVSRVDPQTGKIVSTIRLAGGNLFVPSASIAAGAGAVWVTVSPT